MLDFEKFDWGNDMSEYVVSAILSESLDCIYEKFFEVEENDVVVDVGAFVGSFTYSILHKKPEHCWVIEPVEKHFRTLYKNLKNYQVSFVRGAISDEKEVEVEWVGTKSITQGINFKEFVTNNCIDKIDFLKLDCEGGEYSIFKEENIEYLKNNVRKIAGEIHLREPELKEKFRYFRNNFLVQFSNYEIYSVDGINIKWDLFNEHFIEYYREVHFFIDNRNKNQF